MDDSSRLRATFNEDAERYHRFRPHYPDKLFGKLITDAGISAESRLLEIGTGTGQVTEPLAELGCTITGIELGAQLAEKARKVLGFSYPNVEILTGSFEESSFPAQYFDLVYSATAFHWIKPGHKFAKTAKLLKPDGHLAIIHTEHVSDEQGDAFFLVSQPIYDNYFPDTLKQKTFRLPSKNRLKPPYIDPRLFTVANFNVFPVTTTYSTKNYAGLLSTYSPVMSLPVRKRQDFLAAIEELIRAKFGGSIAKTFAFTLTITQKKRPHRTPWNKPRTQVW